MNLYHLRYFSTLAHIEHYTKAADILAITQPSLSYAISTLEEELGVKLFEKNGRNVTLTKYGKVFLNDVEEILNRLDSSVNSLKLAGKGEGCIDVVFMLQSEIEDADIIEEWLTTRRKQKVHIRVPKKGTKEKLVELALENARMVLSKDRERIKREEI